MVGGGGRSPCSTRSVSLLPVPAGLLVLAAGSFVDFISFSFSLLIPFCSTVCRFSRGSAWLDRLKYRVVVVAMLLLRRLFCLSGFGVPLESALFWRSPQFL